MKSNKPEYTLSRWSREDLLPGADNLNIEDALKQLETQVAEFEDNRPKLQDDLPNDTFMKMIQQMETMSRLAHRVGAYVNLWFAEDTQNQEAQSWLARIEQFMAEFSNRLLFFSLWWKELDEKVAQRLMSDCGDYHYWLEEMRHFRKYTLSEPEEKIINIKDVTGTSALTNLYDAFTNRYSFKIEIDGQEKELTRGELMVNVRMPDPDLRARAYQELYRVYGNDGPILGQMYQTLVRDWRNENINLRGYASPIAARNLANDIPNEVVDTLLEVCQNNGEVFQRYFRLKARWLNMKQLRRYDIYAPVSSAQSEKQYTFSQSAQMVMESFAEFDPQMADMAQRVLDENHLDSEVRKGKRSGAFCLSALPDITPWVLVNYQGKADDTATLAHELGHAIHTMLASHHSLFTFHACLPLAETASTFGEMLLVDRLLAEESDENVRRDLLFRQVDDSYATIMRQAFFALYERQAHELIQQGASVDALSDAYFENLQTQFGDSVSLSDEFRWEWVSIPHIYHVPFYVYAYTFGQLLVLSLYQQYKNEGQSFKPRYLKILSTGGASAPVDILDNAGIDVRQSAFWQGGFDVVKNLVAQLEELPVS